MKYLTPFRLAVLGFAIFVAVEIIRLLSGTDFDTMQQENSFWLGPAFIILVAGGWYVNLHPTSVNVAKYGFLLFVPLDIFRLLSGHGLDAWGQGIVWVGQALVISVAVWYALIDVPNVRVIYIVSGLLFLMVLVWPWFTLLHVEMSNIKTSALEHGVTPEDYLSKVSNVDAISDSAIFNLLNGPGTTFAATPHGCFVPQARGPDKVIVNATPAGTRTAIWGLTALGVAGGIVGAVISAFNLSKLARTPTDRAWATVVVAAMVVLSLLLVVNSRTWDLQDGCVSPPAERSGFTVQFWTKVILHPFGPLLLLTAIVTLWWWPRQFTKRQAREVAFRLSMKTINRE